MSIRSLLAGICFLVPCAATAAVWPTNVVTVSDNAVNTECTGANAPYDCCAGAHPNAGNTCTGNGLESDDIWRGLLVCAFGSDRAPGGVTDPGGCILDLPAGTFTSAEVTISDQSSVDGRSGTSLAGTTPFPNGLWIRGKGRSTILKSSVPPAIVTGSNFNSFGIFFFGNFDPPVGDTAIGRLKFSDFECDGQTPIQSSPAVNAATWGITADTARNLLGAHGCVGSRVGQSATLPRVVVQNLYSHDFMGSAIQFADVSSALYTDNLIENTGCMQDVGHALCDAGPGPNLECTGAGAPDACCTGAGTGNCTPLLCCTGAGTGCDTYIPGDQNSGWFLGPVAGEIECGCGAGDPGDCRGWNVEPNTNPPAGIVGEKEPNYYGIIFSGHGKALIARNTINRSNKYSITAFVSNNPSDWRSSDLVRIHRNTILKGRVEAGTHFGNVWISENTLNEPGMQGEHCNEIAGVASNGAGGRLWIQDNTINPSGCHGIDLHHRLIVQGMKRSTVISGNTITNLTGAWLAGAGLGTDAGRAIRLLADTSTAEGCLTGLGEGLAYPGDVEITNNTVAATFSGYRSLEIEATAMGSDHACPGTQNQLTMSDNVLITGSLDAATQAVVFGKNITMTGFNLTGPGDLVLESGTTGSCSDFTVSAGAAVVDNSGNGIGTCPAVAGGTTLPFVLPATF